MSDHRNPTHRDVPATATAVPDAPHGSRHAAAINGETPGHRAVLEALRVQVADDRLDVVEAFALAALRRVPSSQLAAADPTQTAQQLVDAFRFADGRRPGDLAIRVFTPEVALDGWSEPGTVVQVSSDDRPFLLSTVTEELQLRGLDPVRSLHPIYGVARSDAGEITGVLPARNATTRESFLHIELDDEIDDETRDELTVTLRRLLSDVAAATDDFDAMRDRVRSFAAELREQPSAAVDHEQAAEVAALLDWLLDDNFVLLGTRRYEVTRTTGRTAIQLVPGSGKGILADESSSHYAEAVPVDDLDPELRDRVLSTQLLTISRTNRLATVHRRTRMDYVGVKLIDDAGEVTGELRLVGLFTRKGYTEPARTTPVLRRKLRRILEREDVVEGSHDEITMIALFQALPKDELFQADVDTLHETIIGLFHAEENRETRVIARVDAFTRTVSVLVAVPRDRYSPQLRRQLQDLFLRRFNGDRVDVDLSLGDRAEALVRFNIQVENEVPEVSTEQLEREVRALARSWSDDLIATLTRQRGETEAKRLTRRIVDRMPNSYRDNTPLRRALNDVALIDGLLSSDAPLCITVQPPRPGSALYRLKAIQRGDSLELSSFIPILESIGLTVVEEVPHVFDGGEPEVHVHDFGVRPTGSSEVDVDRDHDRIADAVMAAYTGKLEVDSLNRLILEAGLSWTQVAVLRAYRRYRRQVGTAFTPEYMNDALVAHPPVARALVDLFEGKFSPEREDADLEGLRDAVIAACDDVARLDHDRIMRAFLALMDATLRTNAYREDAVVERPDGMVIPYLSFKLDSAAVPDIPKPVPYREIFVYSPLVEGIHLRGGPVARGGLRWSDRQDDVRTEVLGLMKAQMLKNAVIVPTGAKGGFVVKRDVSGRDEVRAEVERQYVTFIRGLLDVTDNLVGGDVVPPPNVRRHDADDPYLVVAADKGTATFSDLANSIADDYGFWLGDAFASGGSKGYDHKKLGITARGAWVAVRRHFRELGVDTQSEEVTAVGVGDMSGDVFGNGMLLTRTLKLVAAFDHRDIFIDPTPDAATSYEERERLFRTPGVTWQDYQPELISPGGGVFSRSMKSIPLTDEIRSALKIEADQLSPTDLIQAILRAPVDLLWAGGIGTYVKASTESHEDVGDRTNDELRVDANTMRARVFGEGANLSITQLGRIQYARRGGRINQDAIDNAGGVSSSDHEVNLKILLREAVEDGRIDNDERDRSLEVVTEDVVEHVLSDVDRQTWLLSQELAASAGSLDQYEALMRTLEDEGGLDRDVEHLPSTAEVSERGEAGAGLTRPELATLVGYAKRVLTADLLEGDLPEQKATQPILHTYFPPLFVERFGDLIPRHRLRPELVATLVANDVIDRLGLTAIFRLASEAGVSRQRVVAAYWVARELAGAADAWEGIEDLTGMLAPERLLELKDDVDRLVVTLTRAYLDDPDLGDAATVITRDRDVLAGLRDGLLEVGTESQRRDRLDRINTYMDDLVPPDLANLLAVAPDLALGPDVAAVLRGLNGDGHQPERVADAFLRLGSSLAIDRLRRVLDRVSLDGRWGRWQQAGLQSDLRRLQRDAVTTTFTEERSLAEPEAVDRFLTRRRGGLERATELVREVEADDVPRLDAVGVAARAIRDAVERPS